jgi:hypothetical protein
VIKEGAYLAKVRHVEMFYDPRAPRVLSKSLWPSFTMKVSVKLMVGMFFCLQRRRELAANNSQLGNNSRDGGNTRA